MDVTTQKPQRTKFQDALLAERARMQLPRRRIADQCGVDQRTVERWERGEAIPSVQQFKRLIGMLRRVAPFPPTWGWATESALDGRFDEYAEGLKQTVKELERADPTPRPAPQSFGDGLRRIREENDISQDQLGDVVGVSGPAIVAWEHEVACPVSDNLDKLFQVLPELEVGMSVGAIKRPETRDIPKPVGSAGFKFPRATTVDTALQIALESSDAERARPPQAPEPRWTHADTERGQVVTTPYNGPHEHRFDLDETQPGDGPSPVKTGRRICSVCGKPEEPSPRAQEVRRPLHQHEHVVRRCPCNGMVKASGDPERPFVCKRCERLLAAADLHESALSADDVSVLAADFGELTVRTARARRARDEAERAAGEARGRAEAAEAELKTTRELLELAAQEAAK